MTAQEPDSLVYDGQAYHLFSNPLESYFDDENPRPKFKSPASSNWRGYVAEWEIEDDTLYLVELMDWLGMDHETYTGNARLVGVQELFPWAGDRVKATWFTGELRVPQGERLQYVHGGYASTYEEDLLLTFENGKLIRREVRDNRKVFKEREEECAAKVPWFQTVLTHTDMVIPIRHLNVIPPYPNLSWSVRKYIIIPIAWVVFVLTLPVSVPYLIYKRGWNPRKWNLLFEGQP